ncbi:uncharacterized protein [Anoplolepis gracilipes]
MKKILLATTILSIAMSENILMENYLRPKTAWIRDKPFGNKEIKRAPLNEISSEVEEFSNYDDDRQRSRISETRFISDSRNLPSLTFMRSPDLALLPQVKLLSSNKPKLDSAKPTVLISIDIQEGKNVNDNSQKDCSRINSRKHNHAWQIQQPFYVDEPKWISIHPVDSQRLNVADPYILSRGKKIFRIKDTEQTEKMIENYEDFPKYPNKSKRSTKSRVRRSIVMNEKSQNNIINDNQKDQRKEINYNYSQDTDSNNIIMLKGHQDKKSYKIDKMSEGRKSEKDTTSSVHNIFIKKYKNDKIKNVTESLPYKFKFIKQNQILSNHIRNNNNKIPKVNQDKKFNNWKNFSVNMNKRNNRSVLLKNKNFSEVYKKYKTQKFDTTFEENVERNETDMYEQMKTKANINKLNDLNIYNDNTFILFNNKSRFYNRTENSNKKDIDYNKTIERPWKSQYYMHRKQFENEEEPRSEKNKLEIDKNDTEATDSQLMNRFDSDRIGPRIKNYFDHRKKRSPCKSCTIEPKLQDQLIKDIERKLHSLSLERRNKHSDILKDLSLQEPFVISRGKKESNEFENSVFSTESESRNADDKDRFKETEALLSMLLMEMSRCDNSDVNVNCLPNKRSPRDRRFLEEILTAYDPFYVARGKRINLNKFLIKMQSQRNQKNLIQNRWKTAGLKGHVIREYNF